jgi:Predicted hydrolases or acyltransferases (alpha/beta hydrolase superfamily)
VCLAGVETNDRELHEQPALTLAEDLPSRQRSGHAVWRRRVYQTPQIGHRAANVPSVASAAVVTRAGIRLAYDVTGGPSRPAMVLLHGLGERRASWAPVVPRFGERFRVYSFDLRGHGDSDWPGTYSFQLMCDDVLDALDRLSLHRVTLVGHSMGAMVSYLAALRQPARIERLVVEDAPPPYQRDHPVPERDGTPEDFDWPVVPAIIGQVNAGDPTTWARLSSIEAPTLVVAGGTDSHIPQDKLEEVAHRIPCCSLVTIDAGHHVHTSRPNEFAAAVLDWMDHKSADESA